MAGDEHLAVVLNNPMAAWRRFDPATKVLTLTLHVQPGARRTEVAGLHGDALKIKLAAPPVEGRANAELLKFIAAVFSVPLKQVALKQGKRGRRKVVAVDGPKAAPDVLIGGVDDGARISGS